MVGKHWYIIIWLDLQEGETGALPHSVAWSDRARLNGVADATHATALLLCVPIHRYVSYSRVEAGAIHLTT